MKTEDIKTIGVIGSGTMGIGIAQACAQAGYKTCLYDIDGSALKKAGKIIDKNLEGAVDRKKISPGQKNEIISRIHPISNFEELKGELFIEAIIEKLAVKQDLFQRLAKQNRPDIILATNTSSIPITKIANGIPNPERVIGMHFFNPVHIMKLVEIIEGPSTDPEITETIKFLAGQMGKTAVTAKDSPGFIVNRVARHFYVEGLKVLEENVAGFETIDELIVSSGFRMGPFQLMDLIGVDSNFLVTSSMFNSFHQDAKFRPSRIQEQLVSAGYLGRKSGKGFYTYP